jgi:NADH:ubiquinone oxidoreductase subunit 6 (subunit J)
MKKYIWEFVRRGLVSCGFGPIVLAIVYLILRHTIDLQTLPAKEVCTGILSLFALAFIAGGMNFLYQIERLPLMLAILIHGGVLYLSYLGTYLLNGWLDRGLMPILIFTGIFLLGYLVIWAIIYAVNKKNTDKINQLLKDKQQVE